MISTLWSLILFELPKGLLVTLADTPKFPMTRTKAEIPKVTLSNGWRRLCEEYLPISQPGSFWRFSRKTAKVDLDQGWKLHLAATILSAVDLLKIVGPVLKGGDVLFKGPQSLYELDRLNSGLFYGYSQVGKCLTIYPNSTQDALRLAKKLDRLTQHLAAPSVPFEDGYRKRSRVYYRYGAFKTFQIEDSEGQPQYAIRDPNGNLVPDVRDEKSKPDWIKDPFVKKQRSSTRIDLSPLSTTFKVFRALSQRGKGGVYKALDLSTHTPRLCIVKEGRRHGESEWDGRDGFWRVKHEKKVLEQLGKSGVPVPSVYGSFTAGDNYYLVTEHIEGEDLEAWLMKRERRLSIRSAIELCLNVARLVGSLHDLGWAWRDCKLRNLLRAKNGKVRPIDFEGAYQIKNPDPYPYGTSVYLAPEWNKPCLGQSRFPEDVYALGMVFYLIFAGRPRGADKVPLERCRRRIPKGVVTLVAEMLASEPAKRPSVSRILECLEKLSRTLKNEDHRFGKPILPVNSENRGSLRRSS